MIKYSVQSSFYWNQKSLIVNQFQEFVRGFNAVLYFSFEQEVAGL